MLKIVPKTTVSDEIKNDIINILEKALEQAKQGDVECVLVILKQIDGHWSDERSGVVNFSDSIGKLEIIKQSWITEYLKQSDFIPIR